MTRSFKNQQSSGSPAGQRERGQERTREVSLLNRVQGQRPARPGRASSQTVMGKNELFSTDPFLERNAPPSELRKADVSAQRYRREPWCSEGRRSPPPPVPGHVPGILLAECQAKGDAVTASLDLSDGRGQELPSVPWPSGQRCSLRFLLE